MAPPDPLDEVEENTEEQQSATATSRSRRIIRTHLIQISIISMHQNGRDTHTRQVQLYGPRTSNMLPSLETSDSENDPANMSTTELKRRHLDENFSSLAMSQYSVIR
jgi:hypothetical protein